MRIWDSRAETKGGETDHCRKGWSAGGGESLCGGDEGQINMKNRCLDRATKNRLKDVAGEQQKWSGCGYSLSTTSFVLSLAKCRSKYYGPSEDKHFKNPVTECELL